jgi:CRISPR-associated protein Csb2
LIRKCGAQVTATAEKHDVHELAGRTLTFGFPHGIRVDAKHVGTITPCLRRAVMSRISHSLPPEISGHGAENRPHVAYLPLLDAGLPHSRGGVTGVAILCPPGRNDLAALIRRALTSTFPLELPDARLLLRAQNQADWWRWTGPARTWTSVTPMVLDRFPKGNETAEITRACINAKLPEPNSVTTDRAPFMVGAADLGPRELPRQEKKPRPFFHVKLVFPDSVPGPILLGAQRYLGMGLFTAITN